METNWRDRERSSPDPHTYEKSLAAQSQTTGCAADGAPYVVRKLLRRLDDPEISPFAVNSPELPKLAAAFLDKDCAGARGLSEDEIAKLKEIAATAPPPALKQ
jgi:hypothetical protein